MYQIALAQLNIHAGNPRRNVEAMKEAIAKAKENNVTSSSSLNLPFPVISSEIFGIKPISSMNVLPAAMKFVSSRRTLLLSTATLQRRRKHQS